MAIVRNIDDWTEHVLSYLDEFYAREPERKEAEQQYLKAEQSEMNQQDRVEYNTILDAAHEHYWERHCPQHACDLPCSECEQELLEERRAEGFLTFQELNSRSINNMWNIGEHLGPPEID